MPRCQPGPRGCRRGGAPHRRTSGAPPPPALAPGLPGGGVRRRWLPRVRAVPGPPLPAARGSGGPRLPWRAARLRQSRASARSMASRASRSPLLGGFLLGPQPGLGILAGLLFGFAPDLGFPGFGVPLGLLFTKAGELGLLRLVGLALGQHGLEGFQGLPAGALGLVLHVRGGGEVQPCQVCDGGGQLPRRGPRSGPAAGG